MAGSGNKLQAIRDELCRRLEAHRGETMHASRKVSRASPAKPPLSHQGTRSRPSGAGPKATSFAQGIRSEFSRRGRLACRAGPKRALRMSLKAKNWTALERSDIKRRKPALVGAGLILRFKSNCFARHSVPKSGTRYCSTGRYSHADSRKNSLGDRCP